MGKIKIKRGWLVLIGAIIALGGIVLGDITKDQIWVLLVIIGGIIAIFAVPSSWGNSKPPILFP